MNNVKVYQIDLGHFGRYGFEKLVDMEKHLRTVDLELVGVAEEDPRRLREAEKFAESNDVEIETFESVDELYRHASMQDDVMVYDASPGNEHAEHLKRSVDHGFFHLAEKPPSMTREEHRMERKLDEAMWKVDFIERESAVVKKALQVLEDEEISSIRVFRESSIGAEKVVEPVLRRGVMGGDVLDKMTHEIYVLDLLEAAGEPPQLDLMDAHSEYFMPYRQVSDSLMSLKGNKVRELSLNAANGQTHAEFSAGEAEVELHSSWLGPSRESVKAVAEIDYNPFISEVFEGSTPVRSEECRFFIVEGSRNLLGDMLNSKLIDLDSGETLELPELMHDQLYRVLRRAVQEAAADEPDANHVHLDQFMTAVFDVRDLSVEKASGFHEELEKAKKRMDRLILDEQKFESSAVELEM